MTADSEPVAAEEVVLIATFHAVPDAIGELRERLIEMVTLSRVEAGCVRYELHVEDDDPNVLTFIETWESQSALDSHDRTEHLRALVRDVGRLTDRPIDVRRLRKIAG